MTESLSKNYIKKEGWKGLVDYSFLFTIFILVIIVFSTLLNPELYLAFALFFNAFYLIGFIASILMLMLVVIVFATMGIMEKEILFAFQGTGVMKVIYFVVFWHALWAGISSFLWIACGFFNHFDIVVLSFIFGLIGLLTMIYVICVTISLTGTIMRIIDLKIYYEQTIIKIGKDLEDIDAKKQHQKEKP